jgi:DNA (cytosine-5)-methyltransferase 1
MERQFSGLDYSISTAILNAANYGTPQRRERFFMIGLIGNSKPAFPLPTHYKNLEAWNSFVGDFDVKPAVKPNSWTTVEDAFSKLPKNRANRCDYAVMNISEIVKQRMKFIGIGQNFKVVPQELLPNCWTSGKHLGSDTFGRLDPKLPSVTIRTAAYNPSKGRYIHPYEDRGLDTREMAVLQDFPQSWEFRSKNRPKVTLVSAGKQIGNAVPPSLAKALGIAVLKQIK